MTSLWNYIEKQIKVKLDKIPKQFRKLVADKSIGAVLDLTYYITRPFTNNKYYQEMKGIADASGVDFKTLRRIHLIGEVKKGHCSMFGAWGNATKDNHTIQLRSLDWDFEGPYRNYPMVTVYHPSNKRDGNVWMNIGLVGWIGVLSGVS
jgi:isopenicillin-N N-acyltransferase-like protein